MQGARSSLVGVAGRQSMRIPSFSSTKPNSIQVSPEMAHKTETANINRGLPAVTAAAAPTPRRRQSRLDSLVSITNEVIDIASSVFGYKWGWLRRAVKQHKEDIDTLMALQFHIDHDTALPKLKSNNGLSSLHSMMKSKREIHVASATSSAVNGVTGLPMAKLKRKASMAQLSTKVTTRGEWT
jgi:hypothetical protein